MSPTYIGAHIKKETSLMKTLQTMKGYGGNTLQIFASNPRSTQQPNLDLYSSVANDVKLYCAQNKFRIVIHSSYTVNLAKDPREGKRVLDLNDCYWVKLLLRELEVSDTIDSIGVVVHVGKYTTQTEENGRRQMSQTIKFIIKQMQNKKIKSKLIIETPAGAGTELLTDVNDFVHFFNSFSKSEMSHLGICLDTAHIWSSGYDINDYYSTISKTNQKDIMVIHYNNSKKDQGSRVDTHDNIFDGKIDLKDMEIFFQNIKGNPVVILEKPSIDIRKDIKWIRNH
jgi:deoxyribonuclease IV